MYLCHPFVDEIVNLLKSGEIGEVKAVSALYVAAISPNGVMAQVHTAEDYGLKHGFTVLGNNPMKSMSTVKEIVFIIR